MKKVISIILALFLCCSLFVSTVSAAEPTEGVELPLAGTTGYGIIDLVLRSGDSSSTEKLMTEGAKLLRTYCTNAGLSPLASEWWHFNDLDVRSATKSTGTGGFDITNNASVALG